MNSVEFWSLRIIHYTIMSYCLSLADCALDILGSWKCISFCYYISFSPYHLATQNISPLSLVSLARSCMYVPDMRVEGDMDGAVTLACFAQKSLKNPHKSILARLLIVSPPKHPHIALVKSYSARSRKRFRSSPCCQAQQRWLATTATSATWRWGLGLGFQDFGY